ncbi:MAG: hypothetical protein D4R65_09085 [Verrucomicrobiaceae bacterium]|nr:MAG: hypothetical protein D4R65_09085 [Verrucomicrobiaceae bacterium]
MNKRILVVISILAYSLNVGAFDNSEDERRAADTLRQGGYSENDVQGIMEAAKRNLYTQAVAGSGIFEAIKDGNVAKVRDLIETNKSLVSERSEDRGGIYPLHMAAIMNNSAIAELLLADGADVNAKSFKDDTALQLAAMKADASLITTLIKHHADVNAKDQRGLTPLHITAIGEEEKSVLLIAAGAKINARDCDGKTPLYYAADYDELDQVKLLLLHGADPNARSNGGKKPIDVTHDNDIKKILSSPNTSGISRFYTYNKASEDTSAGWFKTIMEWVFSIINSLFVLASFIIIAACQNREISREYNLHFLNAIKTFLKRITKWPQTVDNFMIIGSIALSTAVLWFFPYTNAGFLWLYFSFVMPLAGYALTWKILTFLCTSAPECNVLKKAAVSLTVAILVLQFGFEPWLYVAIKTVIVLPLAWIFIQSFSLPAYRLFLIPVVFSLFFTVTRLLGPDSLIYLFLCFALNGAVLCLVVVSYINNTGKTESLLLNKKGFLEAVKAIIGMRSSFNHDGFNSPPLAAIEKYISNLLPRCLRRGSSFAPVQSQPPLARWFLFVDGKVTGPVVEPELRSGLLTALWPTDILVCKEGDTEWKTAMEVISVPTTTPLSSSTTPICKVSQHSGSKSAPGKMSRNNRRASERIKLIYASIVLVLVILAFWLGLLMSNDNSATKSLRSHSNIMVSVQGGTLSENSGLGALAISSFSISKYETTWADWRTVRSWAAANGYDIGSVGEGSYDTHPVRNVNWFDAVKWCNARSEKEGLTPVYAVGGATYKTGESVPDVNKNAKGYRLPTEAEWEWAARGGTLTHGYTYSGSNTIEDVAWYLENSSGAPVDMESGRGTWPVGQKTANELGLYDMSGNVWEWCWDSFRTNRGLRGGSWNFSAGGCSVSTYSGNGGPGNGVNTVGFRTARSSIN